MPASNPHRLPAPRSPASGLLLAALCGALFTLAGCGNKGPLYLPSSPEARGGEHAESAPGDNPPAGATESR
ncbi:MAG: lipoprotein [Porticoccaceae bacterium]|jgi:predicted small lipoprotein YifL|nr:lipoprotein [Porticoccaceae bacterium]MEA3299582.1 lipoprotein [Pseudomonadota bacterium]HLS97146.1 lipoprotein [Porticoccaceae bacterium]